MHVCLVNPPHPYLKQPYSQAPLGLMYIAAALRARKVSVEICDLSGQKYDEALILPPADLFGITGTVVDRVPCHSVAQAVRDQHPGSKVIVGGPIALSSQHLDATLVDAVVHGEGERVIFDVLADYPRLQPEYRAPRIVDLDTLPFPARDLLEHKGGNIFAFNKHYKGDASTVFITSRGCPYNCAFCASPGIWSRKVIFRSADNVLAETDEVVDHYGINQLRFSDDTFTLQRDRLFAICDGLAKRDVVWRASIRVHPGDREMFERMYAGGCREVSFGVESGDQHVLDVLQKGTTVAQNVEAVINAKRAGMVVRILFMIGTPGETDETVARNIAYLESVAEFYDTVALTTFVPIPGSQIADNPGRYDCHVLSNNIDDYNFYLWNPRGVNDWKSLVQLNGVSAAALQRHKDEMKAYVLSTGKSNKG